MICLYEDETFLRPLHLYKENLIPEKKVVVLRHGLVWSLACVHLNVHIKLFHEPFEPYTAIAAVQSDTLMRKAGTHMGIYIRCLAWSVSY